MCPFFKRNEFVAIPSYIEQVLYKNESQQTYSLDKIYRDIFRKNDHIFTERK